MLSLNYDELLEFAAGSAASVFGPAYAETDSYARRVRLPMPPYLLVDRVLRLEGTLQRFDHPSLVETEYEVPVDAWYAVDGRIPWAIALEGCQADMLLISYLGVDLRNRGERVYRLLDWEFTFHGRLPRIGQTLRYLIRMDRFSTSGPQPMYYFSYDAFADDRLFVTMRNGCAGFFRDDELAAARGVVIPTRAMPSHPAEVALPRVPWHSSYDAVQLDALVAGDFVQCLGRTCNCQALRIPSGPMRMIDRVVSLDPVGGAARRGTVVAEKTLDPQAWYFVSHFKDDPAFPGSLMAEGCAQTLQFYLLALGFDTLVSDAEFQPLPILSQSVSYRCQICKSSQPVRFRLNIEELGIDPNPYAIATALVEYGGKIIARYNNLGIRLMPRAVGAA